MNIQSDLRNLQNVPDAAEVPRSEHAVESPAATSGSGMSTDQAHLSDAASLAMQVDSLPDVRMEKVTAVQAALDTGSYKVSSSDVAEKMIDHMLEGNS